ncbi:hypothetical protein Ddc_17196 [Ditylenchus destructor]|nr:hypothetical protein Ddc_17196 [Ditylenchus destructor]
MLEFDMGRIIPVFLILVIIYTPAGIYDYYNIIIVLAVCFVLCFCRWIFYIQKARFRTADFCSSNDEKILSSLTTDLVIWSAAAVFYFVLYNDILWWSAELIQKCSLGCMLFTVASILANLRLIYAYGGMRKFNLKLARISINVSVNVIKDSESTTEHKSEKSVSDDREKKEEHDEKTI